jgi:hypothetical protein
MAIIIGSTAIKHYFPDFPREPKDLDFAVMPGEKFEKKGGVEYLENSVIHDVYIKTRGFYSSYNGVDFDYGIGEVVKPVQKTITVFE